MDSDIAMMLSVFGGPLLALVIILRHRRNMAKLEIEKLRIEKANLEAEVDTAVQKNLGSMASRIEVLEAIVTDKKYELTDKIQRLR